MRSLIYMGQDLTYYMYVFTRIGDVCKKKRTLYIILLYACAHRPMFVQYDVYERERERERERDRETDRETEMLHIISTLI